MPLDVADGHVVRSELVDAALAEEEHERDLLHVGRDEVEVRLELHRDLRRVQRVSQVGRIPADGRYKRRLGDIDLCKGERKSIILLVWYVSLGKILRCDGDANVPLFVNLFRKQDHLTFS